MLLETSRKELQSPTAVSLVTPVYNQGEYVAQTIESVLAQDYPALQYIVVNDGSTDSTPEVLSRYQSRLRVISQPNAGQASALNSGWSVSSGQYLGYLSADDLLEPQAIRSLANALDTHPDAVVAYGDYHLIDRMGRPMRLQTTREYSQEALEIDLVCLPGAGVLFRRSVFESLGGWNTALRQVPDFEFWLRASRLGPFLRVPLPLARYRVHEDSASYRHVSEARSDEIVAVADSHWHVGEPRSADRAMAQARILAARSHLHCGRLRRAASRWGEAVRMRPSLLGSSMMWRLMAAGAFRKWLYFGFGVRGSG